MARRLGNKSRTKCKNCSSTSGHKLNEEEVNQLAWSFFVEGSYMKTYYGGFTRIQYNEHHRPFSRRFEGPLNKDAKLISRKLGIVFFDYWPQEWRIGRISHLEELEKPRSRKNVIKTVLAEYPIRKLGRDDHFFRLRKNLIAAESAQFDAAPRGLSRARLNNDGYPTLYGSDNIEICIHECKATLADELFIAKLCPVRQLKCLDLSADGPPWIDAFESLDIALSFLFRAGEHSYPLLTRIAKAARAQHLDGIIFPSYYNQLKRTNEIQNIALFGRPLHEGKLRVECINRIMLSEATYEYEFGPVL